MPNDSGRGIWPLTAALLLLFVPFSFSEDFVAAGLQAGTIIDYRIELSQGWQWWLYVGADAVLLAVIGVLSRRAARRGAVDGVRWGWFAVGTVLTLAFGVYRAFALGDTLGSRQFHLVAVVVYSLALTILVAAMVGSTRLPFRSAAATTTTPRFRLAAPLVIGTIVAYLGSWYWPVAADGNLNRQYFAQVSQVIPVLLIAVALEARFLRRLADSAIGKAVIGVTVVTLLAGEALALTVLPVADGFLDDWYSYVAFVVTLEAALAALALLGWAVLGLLGAGGGAAAQPGAETSDVAASDVAASDVVASEGEPAAR